MLHLEAEWPSKQNILIAGTILAEPGPYHGFKDWGGQNTFSGSKYFCFYHAFETNFFEHNRIWGGHKKDLG